MKRFFSILIILVLGSWMTWSQASGPNDEFFQIYNLIQQADRLDESGGGELAKERYTQALDSLRQFSKRYPTWNKEIVGFRIRYLQDKVGPTTATPGVDSEAAVSKALDSPEVTSLKDRIKMLEQTNRGLQQQITVLEAKLNEALSARPSDIEPEELRRAQERISMLERENQLMQTALDDARNTDKNPNAAPVSSPAMVEELERTQRELAVANQKAAEQAATIAKLMERQPIQPAQPASSGVVAPPVNPALNATQVKLAKQEAEIKSLEMANKTLRENMNQLSGNPDTDALAARIKELQGKLNKSNEALYDNQMRVKLAKIETLTNQIAILRTKLDVYEAKKEPYSEEELAMIPAPKSTITEPPSDTENQPRNTLNQLPAGSAPFAEAARRAYASGRLESAEENYRRILALDEDNIYSLNNLAIVLVDQGKTTEAEEILNKTLVIAPTDPKSLGIMGVLKYRTQNFEESFDYLSKAVKVDPENAETQMYLGILLNQKGQRDAAEAALRKAVKLNPNYANAHFNLAIAYATQEPPYLELSRWHYNKSVALGHEKDSRVEAYFKNL